MTTKIIAKKNPFGAALIAAMLVSATSAIAQDRLQPNPQTDQPYKPALLMPGGIVLPLFSPDSPYLNKDKITIPEHYNNPSATRVGSIINIHNPSIEFHA